MSDMCGASGHFVLDVTDKAPSDAEPWRREIREAIDGYVPATEYVWVAAPPTSAELITAEYDDLKGLALDKNASYGDTALNPMRLLSRLDAYEGLAVRADDKLSRLKNAPDAFNEDALTDLIGYLVLMRIARRSHP